MNRPDWRSRWTWGLLWLVLASSGCAVKFVADYDQQTFEEILKVAKKVDHFYGTLLEQPEGQRPYARYSSEYVEIESDLRSLLIRSQARPLNEESTRISDTILSLWQKYKAAHQKNDGYKTVIAGLDRKRFTRLFAAAASAEEAKKLSSEDKSAGSDGGQ